MASNILLSDLDAMPVRIYLARQQCQHSQLMPDSDSRMSGEVPKAIC